MTRKKDLARDDPLLREAVAMQSKVLAARLGREPTPRDPVLFCWHSDALRPMCDLCFAEYERVIITEAEKAGIDPGEALEIAGVEDPLGSLRSTH